MYGKLLSLFSFVLVLALLGSASADFDPYYGLIGHWSFNEGSGTVAADFSSSRNNGTVVGATWDSQGKVGSALNFNGSNDWVYTPGDSSIDFGTDSFTFAFWLKTTATGQRYYIANDRTGGKSERLFIRRWWDTPIDWVQFGAKDDNGHVTICEVPDADYLTGEWVHVAAVRDATADTLELYADTVSQGDEDDNFNSGVNIMKDGLAFGVDTDGMIRYHDGLLDEIRVYNYALDQSDINTLYLFLGLPTKAYDPIPLNGAPDVAPEALLSWIPGHSAVTHDVYFGTGFDDVNDANTAAHPDVELSQGQTEPNYTPAQSPLVLGETYYWRVDEVNDVNIWKGNVWSFTIRDYLIVEDFESYADTDALKTVWDQEAGLAYPSLLTMEHYEGSQSMQINYWNNYSPYYSELSCTYGTAQDWTAKALELWFKGEAGNGAEQMYVVLTDDDSPGNVAVVPYDGDANDLKNNWWQEWSIELQRFNDINDVNLSNIKKLFIGFGDRAAPVKTDVSGIVYFDTIRLKLYPCKTGGLDTDLNGDCVVDFKDVKVMAGEWLKSGTVGADLYVDGKVDARDYTVLANSWRDKQPWVGGKSPPHTPQDGLAFVKFNGPTFRDPAATGVDLQIDFDTGTSVIDSSQIWLGLLKVPTTSEITIEAGADDGLYLEIAGEPVIEDGWYLGGNRQGTFSGQQDQLLPMRLEYFQYGGADAFLHLYWSWSGHAKELIPASAFFHTQSDTMRVEDYLAGEKNNSSIYGYEVEPRRPMPIRPGPHLFIGDYLIESSQNVTRWINQPQRDPAIPNPVVTGAGDPNDENFQPYMTIQRDPNYDPNPFRIWYNCPEGVNPSQSHIGYMESPNGITWNRPHLQLPDPPGEWINFGCEVIDRGSSYPTPSERYKLAYFLYGLRIAVSPDGLTWNRLVPYAVQKQSHDITGISWDPLLQCYVATISSYITGLEWSGLRRQPMQCFSKDLLNWGVPWYVIRPNDARDDGETQFYAMEGYMVRGPLKIGMVKVLRDDLYSEVGTGYGIGYTALAWSLDGKHWTRDQAIFFDRDHAISPQPWDHSHSWIDHQVRIGDEIYLYYGGYKNGHKANRFTDRQIGLVKMQLDRYVARKAEGPTGTLLTVPMIMDNDPCALVVNADASAGSLRVQIRDANDNSVISGLSFADCTSITSDGLALDVRWGTEPQTLQKLANLAEKAVKIEFELTDAKLFSFEFVEP